MAPPPVTILVLADRQAFSAPARGYLARLRAGPHRILEDPAEGTAPDLLLLEVVGGEEGLARLDRILATWPGVPVVVVALDADEAFARLAVQRGAHECVLEGEDDGSVLIRSIDHALERQRLQASAAAFREMIDKSSEAVLVIDRSGVVRFVNPAGLALFACPREELVGKAFPLPCAVGQSTEVEIATVTAVAGAKREAAAVAGTVAELRVAETHWEGAPAWLATLRDVTSHKRLLDDLQQARRRDQHLAYHDPLTGLPNRQLLLDRLGQAVAHARYLERVAVFFVDLDGFKQINDNLGHAAGDEVLRQAAARLQACVRGSDTVARLGGDEFVLLLPGVELTFDATGMARSIRQSLTRPYEVAGGRQVVSASIGISLAPNDGIDPDTVLRRADLAMYRAKQMGKNTFLFYDPAFDSDRPGGQERLRQALECGELRVYYQPQFDLRTRALSGFEALVRWQHPQRGLLRPSEFIPLAESSELIGAIDRWVLQTACAQNRAWQADGYSPVRVAVNLSSRLLQSGSLTQTVEEALRQSGLDPYWLELEVAERQALEYHTAMPGVLADLQQLGVRLVIDDFGAGLGSLTALKRLPIDGVKIDRTLVQSLPTDVASAAITSAIVELGHHLCLQVLAEGVESAGQLEFLREVHCDGVQGFHTGRPQSHGPLTGLLQTAARPRPVILRVS
jgi:diguanylate cyclase (GGDEF)-like protein/PAS domain S-box-containing protein